MHGPPGLPKVTFHNDRIPTCTSPHPVTVTCTPHTNEPVPDFLLEGGSLQLHLPELPEQSSVDLAQLCQALQQRKQREKENHAMCKTKLRAIDTTTPTDT